MRTTLELLELLRDKGRETGGTVLCFQTELLFRNKTILGKECEILLDFIQQNLPSRQVFLWGFNSDTERYVWLDQQIDKLKQEEK